MAAAAPWLLGELKPPGGLCLWPRIYRHFCRKVMRMPDFFPLSLPSRPLFLKKQKKLERGGKNALGVCWRRGGERRKEGNPKRYKDNVYLRVSLGAQNGVPQRIGGFSSCQPTCSSLRIPTFLNPQTSGNSA